MHLLQVVELLCTVEYRIEHSSAVSLFQTQDVQSKHKGSGEVAGTIVLFKALYCKIKNTFFIFLSLFFTYYLCANL